MDNTLEYTRSLPFDIKLIIESKLDVIILSKLRIQDQVSELIFKYRYPETYVKFKNIIKVNKSLDFDNYITEGPYFWKILLRSELIYEKWCETNPIYYTDPHHLWVRLTPYMNIISINMHCMSSFYDRFHKLYVHLGRLMDQDSEIFLLHDVIQYMLITGYSRDLITNVFECNNSGIIDISEHVMRVLNIDMYIFVYFISMFIPKSSIFIENRSRLNDIHNMLIWSDPEGDYNLHDKYYKYKTIYDTYHDHMMSFFKSSK